MDIQMTMVECCSCHMQFAMTTEFNKSLLRCHNEFFCPMGHGQHYTGKSDIEKAREERDRAIRLKLQAQTELEQLKNKHKRKKLK